MKMDHTISYIGHGFEQGDGIKLAINNKGEIVIEAAFECGNVGDTLTLEFDDLLIAYAKLVESAKKE